MSSAEPDSSIAKERKKSAHWSDTDTTILINVLLQHKDSGRTQDNGFKPEVWRIASDNLDSVAQEGGPKTPDACKSRWQRLQRDYKAAKDMEQLPGFAWNKDTGKLSASAEAWEAADKLSMDAYKHQKIHLPLYDSIAVLCPLETATRKGRGKARPSLAASAASEMSHHQHQQHQHQQHQQQQQQQQHAQQQHHQQHQHQQHKPENLAAAFEHVTNGHHSEQHWAGFEAEMEYDDHSYQTEEQSYGLPRPPKRHHMMDPNLMASAASSPTQKRTRQSPILPQTQNPANVMTKFNNGMQQIPQGLRTPNGTHFIHQPSPQQAQHHHLTQIAPQLNPTATTHHPPPPQQPPMMQLASRSPDFPNPALLDNSLQPPISDIQSAGLSEPQRRSAAILMLQDRESDMPDDELVDIVTEFELNVTSADTYLALSKPGVRKVWLQRLLQRVATHGHGNSQQQQASLDTNGFGMNHTQADWGARGQQL